MRKLLCIFFLFPFILNAQSPGNVGTANLTAWFKTDGLANGNLTSWSTSYPSGASALTVTDASSPFPQATNSPASGFTNYNSVVDFSGSTSSNRKVMELAAALNLVDNNTMNAVGSFIGAYHLPGASVCLGCHVINYRESASGDGIQFRTALGGRTGRFAIGSGGVSANASRDYTQDNRPDMISYFGNRSGAGTMSTFRRSLLFTGGASSSSSGREGLVLGARVSGANYDGLYDGLMYELIFFNKDLSTQEFAQVHSYLAIKFGIILDNSGGGAQGDYYGSNGSLIWDASDNPAYHNDIIGIAEDFKSALSQKQSHTQDDSTRIYLGLLANTNAANTTNFNTDSSYLILGNNRDQLCGTASSNLEIPAGSNLQSRFEREWKLTNTNFSGSFSIDIKAAACAMLSGVNSADLRLLVDDDGDFTNAQVQAQGLGIQIAVNANMITISGLTHALFTTNETKFFTIAVAGSGMSTSKIDLSDLSIYPNPIDNHLNIEVKENLTAKSIQIYNALAQDVTARIMIDRASLRKAILNFSEVPSGIYLIEVDGVTKEVLKR